MSNQQQQYIISNNNTQANTSFTILNYPTGVKNQPTQASQVVQSTKPIKVHSGPVRQHDPEKFPEFNCFEDIDKELLEDAIDLLKNTSSSQ